MVTYTRQALYDILWSEPTRTFAQRVGVSDVTVAKVCRAAGIPLPPRGYWARNEAQQKLLRIALPLRFPGASDSIEVAKSLNRWGPDWRKEMMEAPIPDVPVFPESIEDVALRAQRLIRPVKAEKDFSRTFGDISKLLAHDEERRKSPWSIDRPLYDLGSERRRLLLLLSLFRAVHAIGGKASLATTSKWASKTAEDRRIRFRIGHQWLSLQLEPTDAPTGGKEAENRKNSRMRLLLESRRSGQGSSKTWQDEDHRPVERQLTAIMVDLLVIAEERCRAGAFEHREWLIKRKADLEEERRQAAIERERKAREKREREERERIRALIRQAADLQRAGTIRSYVASVREGLSAGENAETLERWAIWALAEADRIDPVKSGRYLEFLRSRPESDDDELEEDELI